MPISDSQKTDFLWKKVIFGTTNSAGVGVGGLTPKQGFEETIGSPVTVFGNAILSESIPVPAPNATGPIVQFYPTTSALQMTPDPTVAGNRTWIATSTFNTLSSRLPNWVPPSIHPGYLVEVFRNSPTVPANKLLQGTNDQEWVFDYSAGVLNFVNNIPAGITTLWLVGHRYVGRTGLMGAGINLRDTAVVYTGNSIAPPAQTSYTFSNFFDFVPQGGTIVVEINGGRIEQNMWSTSGRDLIINLVTLPYGLDPGDVVSATYAWQG